MKIEDILAIGDTDKIIATIQALNAFEVDPVALQAVYDGDHEILNRSDKVKTDAEGNPISLTTVAKMVLKYQKKIVESSIAFLFGSPVSLNKTTEGGDEAYQFMLDQIKQSRWHSTNRELARALFTQTRAAKLYFVKNPEDPINKKIGCLVLRTENGGFWPNFNDDGDMDAFLRVYKKKILVDGAIKEIDVFELYTATSIQKGEKPEGAWAVTTVANPYLKIPVVYYEQPTAEWEDVQTLIDRQELSLSELIDTNQYFSAPIPVIQGEIENLPDKQDQGKVVQLKMVPNPQTGALERSEIHYLTWDQRPESLNMQFDLIEKAIYSFSQTADISFLNMIKNQPGNISGVALKVLLLDPILKSYNKQELFDEMLQREISVIMAIGGQLNVAFQKDYELIKVDVQFNSIMPDNIAEVIGYLSQATGGNPIMSTETAVQKNPLITDKEAEIERLNASAATEAGSFEFNNE